MSSKIGVQNIAHTNGTNAMTVSASGVTTFTNTPVGITPPAIVKLVTLNLSNAADATISSTYINSTYDTYKFIYDFLPTLDSAELFTRAIVGGSEDTGNNYGFETLPLDGGSTRTSDSTNVMAVHNKYQIGNGAGEGISGEFTLFNVNSNTRAACISGHSTAFTSTPVPTQMVFGGAYKSDQRAKVLNGLRLFMETSSAVSNIASGFITVYGVVK